MRYTVIFNHDKIGRTTRKNAEPSTVSTDQRSLELRLDLLAAEVRMRCARILQHDVQVEIGTHRGTAYRDDIPVATFTIDPPLEPNDHR